MKKILISNKGQISMELGILLGAAIAVASIAGFYYLKNVKDNSFTSKESTLKVAEKTHNKAVEYVDNVHEVLNNG
jgi:uncharacterized protein (UPF0333 family)